ncbi:SRPBCC family protein [Micromonospora orduensis]|uniref:SRPBCC family protein n=1 Tax=Micromonospora orduensis TaxID=1420891 RepID=A0A5C4QUX7_9ACTN|nr:SRPBCC family protein [Micromonospora orduensis]TNH29737.1 SRPBCC family protein [Micromonospora orduensis]
MTRTPAGRLFRTATGHDLVLTRTFRAPAADVWASLTEPERTARWFGPWEGDAAPGRTIRVQMAYEEQQPWCDFRVDACEPGRRLAVSTTDDFGTWLLELSLTEAEGGTELRLVQHLSSVQAIAEVGAGWEYYLDMLVASRDGSPRPEFDEYHPAMRSYYETLAAAAG